MVDLILFAFECGVFYGGFWCGNRYASLKDMANAALDQLRGAK